MAESSINLRADLRQLSRDLQTAGNMEAGKAEALVISLEKRLRAAEAAAKKTSAAQAQAAKASGDWNAKLAGLQQVASQLPGPLAQIATTSLSASKGLGTLGVATGGLAGGVAAAGALALGLRAVSDAAVEAEQRLVAAGLGAEIPQASRDSVREYRESTVRLREELDQLTVGVGAAVSGPLTDLADIATNLNRYFREGSEDIEAADLATDAWGATMRLVNPIGMQFVWMLEAQAEGTRTLVEETERLSTSQLDYMQSQAELDDEARRSAAARADAVIEQHRRQAEEEAREDIRAAEAFARAQEERARAAVAASREAEAAQIAFNRSVLDASALFDQLAEEDQRRLKAANEAQHEQFLVAEAMAASERETAALADELDRATLALAELPDIFDAAFGKMVREKILGTASMVSDAFGEIASAANQIRQQEMVAVQEIGEEQVRLAQEEAEARAASQEQHIADLLAAGAISQAEADRRLKAIDSELKASLDAADQLADDERDQLLKTFKATQNLQRTQAVMDAARAAVSMIPAFAWAGPGAPFLAADAAALALATQLAIINSQSPPTFPTGGFVGSSGPMRGSPDHHVVGVQEGEGIASRRAMADPAVREAVSDGNRGVRDRARSTDTVVRVGLDPRLGRLRVTTQRIGKRASRRR